MQLFKLTKAGRHDGGAGAAAPADADGAGCSVSTYGVPGLKAALNLVGYDVGVPRPPLLPLPDAAVAALRDALAQFEEIPA